MHAVWARMLEYQVDFYFSSGVQEFVCYNFYLGFMALRDYFIHLEPKLSYIGLGKKDSSIFQE